MVPPRIGWPLPGCNKSCAATARQLVAKASGNSTSFKKPTKVVTCSSDSNIALAQTFCTKTRVAGSNDPDLNASIATSAAFSAFSAVKRLPNDNQKRKCCPWASPCGDPSTGRDVFISSNFCRTFPFCSAVKSALHSFMAGWSSANGRASRAAPRTASNAKWWHCRFPSWRNWVARLLQRLEDERISCRTCVSLIWIDFNFLKETHGW